MTMLLLILILMCILFVHRIVTVKKDIDFIAIAYVTVIFFIILYLSHLEFTGYFLNKS